MWASDTLQVLLDEHPVGFQIIQYLATHAIREFVVTYHSATALLQSDLNPGGIFGVFPGSRFQKYQRTKPVAQTVKYKGIERVE